MKAKKAKVLFITGSFPPAACGVGDYTYLLSRELYKSGFDVEVMTSAFNGTMACSKGVKVTPCVTGWGLLNGARITETIKRAAPDIVHFQYPNLEYKKNILFNILPGMIKRVAGNVKIVETFHEPLSSITIFGQVRHAINILFADGLIFSEKEGYDTLPFFLKWPTREKERVIIPVASNIRPVKNLPENRRKLLKKFGIDRNKQVWITFGFISEAKGYEALVKLYDGQKHAWIHLGSAGLSEEYRERFLKKSVDAGVKINFTGTLPPKKIAQYLGAGDVVIFTFKGGVSSRNGSFLAARSQGAYIAAFHKEKRGYYKDENAYYAACGDIEALRKALMFKNHPRYIKPKVFSWHEISEKHEELYLKLLEKNKEKIRGD